MRAARLHGWKEPFVIDDIPTPEPGPGEVLVKIAGAGVCHSDLHIHSGELSALPFEFPLTLGHENAGWVESVGAGVRDMEPGQAVVVMGGWGCGHCRVCLDGEEQLCDVLRWGGIGPPGGFAEYLLVPAARHLVPLPTLDPANAAPLADAALTPYRAVKHALPRLVPGSTAVVIGVGGLGQFGVRLLDLLTTATVAALDTAPDKREIARELGAALAGDPSDPSAETAIMELAGAEGAAAVFDCVGSDATLALASRLVGRKGVVVVIGLAGGTLHYSFLGLRTEASVTSSAWGSRTELGEVVALAEQGALSPQVEQRPLDEINQAFANLRDGKVRGRLVLVP